VAAQLAVSQEGRAHVSSINKYHNISAIRICCLCSGSVPGSCLKSNGDSSLIPDPFHTNRCSRYEFRQPNGIFRQTDSKLNDRLGTFPELVRPFIFVGGGRWGGGERVVGNM
jgi:hypothetical protein